jgi:hypothetical protein
MGAGSIVVPRTAECAQSAVAQESAQSTLTCFERRSSWPHSTPECRSGTFNSPPGTADPRTTTIYDRRREIFDRHAAYVVVAFVAGA